jgi:hypothetical protein
MKIELELDTEQVSEIIRKDLIECYKFDNLDDPDFGAALKQVIRFYSTPKQYQEFLAQEKSA